MNFNVDEWLRTRSTTVPVQQFHVSQPFQVGCWTKISATEGGQVLQGNTTGAAQIYEQTGYTCKLYVNAFGVIQD